MIFWISVLLIWITILLCSPYIVVWICTLFEDDIETKIKKFEEKFGKVSDEEITRIMIEKMYFEKLTGKWMNKYDFAIKYMDPVTHEFKRDDYEK